MAGESNVSLFRRENKVLRMHLISRADMKGRGLGSLILVASNG